MTPSVPGLTRTGTSGTKDASSIAPAAGTPLRTKPTERAGEPGPAFSEVLRQRRSAPGAGAPEPKHEEPEPQAIAGAGAQSPATDEAKAGHEAQNSPDAAQDSDDPGAVVAAGDESEASGLLAEDEAAAARPGSGNQADLAGSEAPVAHSAPVRTAALPASPVGQTSGAEASAESFSAGRVEASGGAAEPVKSDGPVNSQDSAVEPALTKGPTRAAAQVSTARAPELHVDSASAEAPRTDSADVEAPVSRQARLPVASEAGQVKPHAPVTGAEAGKYVNSGDRTEKPVERAEQIRGGASREVEAKTPTVVRHAAPDQGRSIFVVSADAEAVVEPPKAQGAQTPVANDSGAASAAGRAPSTASAPSAEAAAVVARVSEDGAPRNDSSDAGERREGSRREAAPVRPESAGAKLDPAPVIAGDAGVVQAPSLGSASTPGVKLEAQRAPTEAQVVAQSVARGLSAAVNQRGGSLTLRLVPESLGLVRIHMSIDQGAVSVRLEATNPAAQGLLTEHIAMLRGSLESRGLTIDKLSVQYSPLATVAGASIAHGSGQNSAGAGQQQSQGAAEQQSTWQDAAGGESRGRQEAEQEQAEGRSASGSDIGARQSAEPGAQVARFGGRLRMRLETVA